MKFKTKREEDEFLSKAVDQRLKDLVNMIDLYMRVRYGKRTTITGVMRTQEEQDFIYRANPAYQVKPWMSVHQIGRGVDIRCNDMTEAEITDVVEVLNRIPYRTPGKSTAIRHNVGAGDHIHIQV